MIYKVKYFDVLCIKSKSSNVEIVQSLLNKYCLGSYLVNGITNLYFEAGIKNTIDKELIEISNLFNFEYNWDKQNQENWHLAWQENFKPININGKLRIIPYWDSKTKEKNIIKIKPGMAFGTGHHETTWLVLNKMIEYIKSDISILDCGSGSGILSIAAKKLGAKKIDSVEFDIDCKDNFLENIKINNINKDINYYHSDILLWKNYNYDMILVNINKNILMQLIPKLESASGLIILSGLLESDYNSIESLLINSDFKILDLTTKGEWICLVVKK